MPIKRLFILIPSDTTPEKTGASMVNMKFCCTIMHSALADGTKLPPYVALKRKTLPKITFPAEVVVHAQENSLMNSDLVMGWIKTV